MLSEECESGMGNSNVHHLAFTNTEFSSIISVPTWRIKATVDRDLYLTTLSNISSNSEGTSPFAPRALWIRP